MRDFLRGEAAEEISEPDDGLLSLGENTAPEHRWRLDGLFAGVETRVYGDIAWDRVEHCQAAR